jgi:hypothetical protein
MNVNIPSAREPITGNIQMNVSWYRYFAENDSFQITALKKALTELQAVVATQATEIQRLENAVSTIRDVAMTNTLTGASEIPDLGRL